MLSKMNVIIFYVAQDTSIHYFGQCTAIIYNENRKALRLSNALSG